MKTKNIFKTLALVMMIPAMLLTTACSKDDVAADNIENTANKGYTLPLTVNVTRQGDEATTRATYNETTKKLSFSTGDQLFVGGNYNTTGSFAGALAWVSGETFSGTITTNEGWDGTADALLTHAYSVYATLLPNGYENYDYFYISQNNGYNADIIPYVSKAFTTSKATAVEQFSEEHANSYSSGTGFVLSPQNAILNFTIFGLRPSVSVNVKLTQSGSLFDNKGSVTTTASGAATFAVAVNGNTDLKDLALTVDDKAITLGSTSTTLEAGHIYNIGRSLSPLASVTAADMGKVIGANGKIYNNAAAAKADNNTMAVAMIVYVGSATGESSPYNHGLALAMSDVDYGNTFKWKTESTDAGHTKQTSSSFTSESGLQYNSYTPDHNSDTYPAFKNAIDNDGTATPTGCSAWFLPTGYQWNQMINACKNVLGTKNSYEDLRDGFTNAGGTNLQSSGYWSATEVNAEKAWRYYFSNGLWSRVNKGDDIYHVRSALAF